MLSNREMLHEKEFAINHINKYPSMYIYHIHTRIRTRTCTRAHRHTHTHTAVRRFKDADLKTQLQLLTRLK